ncbi:MAG: cytochrome c maturation protein CcmE [Acidimicrobiales bacterium]
MTELDLTPRPPADDGRPARRSRSYRNIVIVGLVGLALVAVLYQALTSARVYFYNVDEAVAQRDDLGDRRFRMQGTVVADNGLAGDGSLLFTLAFADATADVRHIGDEPSNLFAEGEQVVVEGLWEGEVFRSHQVLVKHSEEYIEDNPERVDYELDPSVG